jgi:ketosteroid isomerase-like protein
VREAIAAYFESINGEDWDRLAALFHEDAELIAPGTPPRRGGRAVASYYDDALRPYPVHRDEPTREIYAEEVVTVEIRFEGELANGAPIAFDAVDVFDFVDGRIAHLSSWYDSHQVRTMLLEAATADGAPKEITPARRRYALGRARRGEAFRLDAPGRPATWSAGAWPDGLATRAVLIEVGDGALDAAALEATAPTRLRPADALLIHTGGTAPAIGATLAPWLAEHGIAAVAFDARAPDADLGVPIGSDWSLDALRADCERHGTWDGFLVSAPSGDVANPIIFR